VEKNVIKYIYIYIYIYIDLIYLMLYHIISMYFFIMTSLMYLK